MEGIAPFQSGRPLLSELNADKLNRILAEIKRNRPVVAAPLAARITGDGTYISLLKMPTPGGAAPSTEHPFQLSQTTGEDPELTYIRVRYGTIDGVAPTGMSLGDDPPYVLTPDTESGVIYAVVTWDPEVGAPLLSRDLGQAEELPEDEDDTAHVEIGSWTTDENDNIILAQAITNSIDVVICRNWFAVEGPYWNVTFLT
jgi:hypothetical protein